MAIGIGISPFLGIKSSAGVSLGTTIATTHYNRVIADGGVLPAGISGLGSVLDSVISAYSITGSSDFNTKVPVFLDPHYTGYKLGAGSGTTLGQAARTVYAINSSADVTQTTAASQPLLLAHSGVNYWWGSGVSGNYCSTPSAAANNITGDIEFIAKVDYKNNGSNQVIIDKENSYTFYIEPAANKLDLNFNTKGGFICTTTLGSSYTGWVKASRIASSGTVNFYTSTDGVTYTQLGTTLTGTTGALDSSTSTLKIGTYISTNTFPFQGKIYRATISNSIGGTPVVDFNPASYNAAVSQTSWTSSTGEVWTINTDSAASGFVGRLVNRTIMAFGGDASQTRLGPNTSIQVNQPDTVYAAFKFDVFNSFQGIYDSNTNTTRQYSSNNRSSATLDIGAGIELSVSGLSQNTLKLSTGLFNGATSSLQVNNGTATTGNVGTQKMDGLRIGVLANSPPQYTLKGIVNTILVSSAADNSTIKTAIYNLAKSMNNNAF